MHELTTTSNIPAVLPEPSLRNGSAAASAAVSPSATLRSSAAAASPAVSRARVDSSTGVTLFPISDEAADTGLSKLFRELSWHHTKKAEHLTIDSERYTGILNLYRLNDIPRLDKFFEKANQKLSNGQYYVVCLETKEQRKERILNQLPVWARYPYYALDFIYKRVFPKWQPTCKICYWLSGGRNRVLTLTESMGRLTSSGFSIVDYKQASGLTYIVTRKSSTPVMNRKPTLGLFISLSRVGYKGEKIDVYKLRTMHPYSEFIQGYLYDRNSTENGDKIVNDFRVTRWGKWFRKLWIDELPMLYNWFRRELKVVGVRPLSEHKFNTYPSYLQQKRVEVKPGLVPPFYADLPESVEEFYESEERYLEAYKKNPIRTDIRYFIKAFYNIAFRGARSN